MATKAPIGLAALLLVGCAGEVEPPTVTFLASSSSIRLDEDGSASVILSAEVFNSSELITYEVVDEPALGQLVGTGSVLEYVGADDANGDDSFTWRAVAGDDASELYTVDVFITPVNDAPRGQNASLVTDEDTPRSDALVVTDAEGDELVFAVVQAPDSGTVDIDEDGAFTYIPDTHFVGTDFFLWSAQDPQGASTGPVRVDINVGGINDIPVVQNDGILTQEDRSVNGQVIGSDPDGDNLTWRIVTPPAGDLVFNEEFGSFTYTPVTNFFGGDFFEVIANDGTADSEIGRIDITVTSVNDVPIVPPTTFNVDEDTTLVGTVVWTDVEEELKPTPLIGFRIAQAPRNGVVSIDGTTGNFTYTPNPNSFGVDDFTVIASDPQADSLPGRITVSVTGINDAPRLANVGIVSTDEDIPATGVVVGLDPEGDLLTYSLSAAPSNGSVTVSPVTGALVYVPALNFNGTDQFQIVASDGQLDSDPAVVDVLVLPVNDRPVPGPASIDTITGESATITLTANDPEGDSLVFLITQQPANGAAVVDSITGDLVYTPNPTYTGPDVILWAVTDGELQAGAVLPIAIAPDSDSDGIGDNLDNCIDVPNPEQGDASGNGVGDVCDCYADDITDELNPDFFADSERITISTAKATSDPTSMRLDGMDAFAQTFAFPSCNSFFYRMQVAAGPPAPETFDSLELQVRVDGGDWTVVDSVFGLGVGETFEPIQGQTLPSADLTGDLVEFRLFVNADEGDDLFFVDDLEIFCDTDADDLGDCIEGALPNFDPSVADADMDGLNDGAEFELGTDPNSDDTDFDMVLDPDDNCPVDANTDQLDTDGDGIGDVCDGPAFVEDFENGAPDWTVQGDWAVGTPTSGPGSAFEGTGVAATSLTGNYQNGIGARALTSPEIDLTNVNVPHIQFQMWYQIESSWDGALLEVSDNGGATWTQVPSTLLDVPYTGTGNGSNPLGSGTPIWTNTSGGNAWTRVRADISSLLNDSSQVSVRWRFGGDTSVSFAGYYLDNVYIGELDSFPDN